MVLPYCGIEDNLFPCIPYIWSFHTVVLKTTYFLVYLIYGPSILWYWRQLISLYTLYMVLPYCGIEDNLFPCIPYIWSFHTVVLKTTYFLVYLIYGPSILWYWRQLISLYTLYMVLQYCVIEDNLFPCIPYIWSFNIVVLKATYFLVYLIYGPSILCYWRQLISLYTLYMVLQYCGIEDNLFPCIPYIWSFNIVVLKATYFLVYLIYGPSILWYWRQLISLYTLYMVLQYCVIEDNLFPCIPYIWSFNIVVLKTTYFLVYLIYGPSILWYWRQLISLYTLYMVLQYCGIEDNLFPCIPYIWSFNIVVLKTTYFLVYLMLHQYCDI